MARPDQLWLTLVVLDLDVISFVIPEDRAVFIGRDPSANDFVLHDTKVSRIHARVSPRDGTFVLQDLSSAGGTRVNGRRLKQEAQLKDGDVVKIGPYRLHAALRPWRHLTEDEAGIRTQAFRTDDP
ncbi:MAG: FHA domain-containing protein [Myxococcota bacterium]